jgi:hypothetical protein
MKTAIENSGSKRIFLAFAAIAWLYIWLRAYFVQFSIDECATFIMYVQTGRFLPPDATVDANNHILNSFLSWCLFTLFGSNPLVLRLPNVLAALLYFYFVWKLSTLLSNKLLQWALIILFLGTHFIIEFFGYCRGYGLSMAFLLGSVYYTILLVNTFRPSTVIKALLAISLATLANFNLIFIALTMFLVLSLILYGRRKTISLKFRWVILIGLTIVAVLFAFVIFASFDIRKHSGFYYGSADGFFPVTVETLARMLTGMGSIPAIISLALFFLLTISLFYALVKASKGRQAMIPALFAWILIVVNWAGSFLLNRLFGVNFQEDRAAMHYVPLFYLFILFVLESQPFKRIRIEWLLLMPLLAIPVYSATRISLDSGVYGHRQQVPESYFSYISSKYEPDSVPPVVSSRQTRKQPWAFLNYRSGGKLNLIQSSGYPLTGADFIILEKDMDEFPIKGYRVELEDHSTNTVLLAKEVPPKIADTIVVRINDMIWDKRQYQDIATLALDQAGQDILVTIDCVLKSQEKPFEGAFVVEVFDSLRNNLCYEAIDLDQLRCVWSTSNGKFTHSLLIHHIPLQAESLVLYFWNKNEKRMNITRATITFSYISKTE